MKTYKWFDEKRLEMIISIADKMLYPQLFGHLSSRKLIKIIETLETANVDVEMTVDERSGDITEEMHSVLIAELGNEISQAIVGETVRLLDAELIEELSNDDTRTIDLDASDGKPLMERLPILHNTIDEIITEIKKKYIKTFSLEKSYIIASPLMISVLQSSSRSVFAPEKVGAFKGPNNTMLIGLLDGISVYSYIFDSCATVELIIGYNDIATGECESKPIIVRGLSFI